MRIGLLTILPTNFNIALGNLDYFKENKVFKFYKFVFSDSLSINLSYGDRDRTLSKLGFIVCDVFHCLCVRRGFGSAGGFYYFPFICKFIIF